MWHQYHTPPNNTYATQKVEDLLVALSDRVRRHLIEQGIPAENLEVKPNIVPSRKLVGLTFNITGTASEEAAETIAQQLHTCLLDIKADERSFLEPTQHGIVSGHSKLESHPTHFSIDCLTLHMLVTLFVTNLGLEPLPDLEHLLHAPGQHGRA